ncbi:P63C domain-containing protein [Acinetobacter piscicola]|uniref:P63C domain-containing protein n=1 Tax=Acinetobacter piscicola TaxID=2006115 RepID=UPI001BC8813F|nr:P63C domain-containing protein [Acinetobacter piscicola]
MNNKIFTSKLLVLFELQGNKMSNRVNSGKATAEKMTVEQRKERAMKGVERRKELASLPKATHRGELIIGDIDISCAVLEDGRRVISEHGINNTLGSSGGKTIKLRDAQDSEHGPLPLFIASKALHPFIGNVFTVEDLAPIKYLDNGKEAIGYPASILPKVCDVWLKARDAKTLQQSQFNKALKADILMRGLAHVGIQALVDEATGYEKDREKNALAKILEAFVAKELQPWLKTFPDEYYRQIFRLYNLPYPPKKAHFRPGFIGTLTNEVVYERLAPELLPELKKEATKLEKKARLHQFLSSDVGHPKLREHLASLITLLKLSNTPEEFKQKVDLIHPRFGNTYEMNFND